MSLVPQRQHREEVLNALTHGFGLVAALIGTAVLLGMSVGSANPLQLPSVAIYSASLILVYLSSTLYHRAGHAPTKSRLQVFDHCAIYLLIAGTYTPLVLLGVGGRVGWTLCVTVWSMAAAGIVFKWFFTGRMHGVSLATYLAMGWLAVFAGGQVLDALPAETVVWVVAGGLSYTLGSFVFLSTMPYAHTVWHLFVLAGSACHWIGIHAKVAGA